MTDINILSVWAALGGGKLLRQGKQHRGKAFWRNGDGWNIRIRPDTCQWFDFATGSGGGPIGLVSEALQLDRRDSIAWLERERFLGPLTGEQKRARRAMRSETQRVAEYYEAVKFDLSEYLCALFNLRRHLRTQPPSNELLEEIIDNEKKIQTTLDALDVIADGDPVRLLAMWRSDGSPVRKHGGKDFSERVEKALVSQMGLSAHA